MKNKNFLFTFLFLTFISFSIHSQIEVSRLNDVDLPAFKATTTYFILPEFDTDKKGQYEQAMKDAWTITPFKVLTAKEAESPEWKKDPLKISKIFLSGIIYMDPTDYTANLVVTMFYYRKDKLIEKQVAYSPVAFAIGIEYGFFNTKPSTDELTAIENKKNDYTHYSPGYIKGYLMAINGYLVKNLGRGFRSSETDKEETAKALQGTLYIPQYIIDNAVNKDMLAKAKFKYQVMPTAEMDAKILKGGEPFYYLDYSLIFRTKMITIMNASTGKIVCSIYAVPGIGRDSYVFNTDDVDSLNKFKK
ncbi:MAG: hypothetical protein JWP12_1587 [Bacteroidetes bacterium]|nr:hypothetical protein [Bacteroidota bacterium]